MGNCQNRGPSKNNKSGHVGILYRRDGIQASITRNGRTRQKRFPLHELQTALTWRRETEADLLSMAPPRLDEIESLSQGAH